jgi:nucleotide-binding universal stress UspA family protein
MDVFMEDHVKALVTVNHDSLSLGIFGTVHELLRYIPDAELHLAAIVAPRAAHGALTGPEVTSGAVGTVYTTSPRPLVVESHGQAVVRVEAEEEQRLRGIASANFPGVACFYHVRLSDDPAAAIVALAGEIDADLIVMATHGRSGVGQMVRRSVTEEVIRSSGKPVLVRRPAAV